MLTAEQRSVIIERASSGKMFSFLGSNLPDQPTFYDLIKFLKLKNKKKWLHNKRYFKKLVKNFSRYVPKHIYHEFMLKVFARPLWPRINYSDIASKIVKIEPMPEGALQYLPEYDKYVI